MKADNNFRHSSILQQHQNINYTNTLCHPQGHHFVPTKRFNGARF